VHVITTNTEQDGTNILSLVNAVKL